MSQDGNGSRAAAYDFTLEVTGCLNDVLDNSELLREFVAGLWRSAVGVAAPNTVVNRLARPQAGYTVTQMGAGCTLIGRFDPDAGSAHMRFTSVRLMDVAGAERYVQEALRPATLITI